MNATIDVDRSLKEIVIHAPFDMRDDCRNLSSRRWDKDTKTWRSPLTLATLEEVLYCFNGRAIVSTDTQVALEALRDKASLFSKVKNRMDLGPDEATFEWKRGVLDDDGNEMRPMHHQVSGTMALLTRKKALLLDQPGLGKTKQQIDAACDRLRKAVVRRVVILCPATLKGTWRDEILKWSTFPCDPWQVLVLEGDKQQRYAILRAAWGAPWLIANYELARIHAEEINALVEGEYLICDEAHRLKSITAQITKAVHAMRPEYVNLSTGTPVANKPEDLFSLVQLVEPGLMGATFYQFQDRYMVRQAMKMGGRSFKEVVGYKNLDDMRLRLDIVSVRRLKDQVMDLPPKVYKRREIEMGGDQAREYRRMQEDMIAFYREVPETQFRLHARTAVTQILRLQQIADGFLAVGDLPPQWFEDQPKIQECRNLVEELLANNRKVVIWSRFLAVTERLEQEFRQFGAVRIHGQVPALERTELVRRFQEDPSCRVFVGQIHTGGLGLTLTASSDAIFYDLWWSPSVVLQAEDRQHRIGTRDSVTIVNLICRNSIDARVEKMLKTKGERIDLITGDADRITKKAFMSLLGVDTEEEKK